MMTLLTQTCSIKAFNHLCFVIFFIVVVSASNVITRKIFRLQWPFSCCPLLFLWLKVVINAQEVTQWHKEMSQGLRSGEPGIMVYAVQVEEGLYTVSGKERRHLGSRRLCIMHCSGPTTPVLSERLIYCQIWPAQIPPHACTPAAVVASLSVNTACSP